MTDESKVKTTFIRPVNRTMSYEDRRGYVYVYVCMIGRLNAVQMTSLMKTNMAALCFGLERAA